MPLFDSLFYSGPMLAVFSEDNRLRRMLDFESALSLAQAACGVIPSHAAESIAHECAAFVPDRAALMVSAAESGNLAIPLIRQLTEAVGRSDGEAAKYVHWGATSQDVIDTGFVLQAREGFDLLEAAVSRLCAGLTTLVETHGHAPMAGRTWLQHAVPITFGWKAAGWLDAMLRHRDRLQEARARALALQFGGAAGTLASLGSDGDAVLRKLADTLHLSPPDISWHASRDRIAEIATVCGLIVGTLGKIAKDISLLIQTEVGEVFEAAGRGGSSTMPQKRNPVECAAILSAAIRTPGLVATVLTAMLQEHERGLGNWGAEWETLPEIFNLCAGALERANELIAGLDVDTLRMRTNLDLTQGLVMAEAVSMALAAKLGKATAHQLVQRACIEAIREKKHLRQVLSENEEFEHAFTLEELDRLFNPASYLGIVEPSLRRVLHSALALSLKDSVFSVDLGEVNLRCALDGPKDKPLLILSNSLGTNLSMWFQQIEAFSGHFQVLRYDTRGHGGSSVPPGPYSIEMLGRDVLALADRLGIEHFCFCGLSMGGMIGQWLGVNSAGRLDKLVLCNTAAKIGTAETWNTRIDKVLHDGVEPVIPGVLERWFTPGFRQAYPDEVARTRSMLETASAVGYAAACAAVRDMDQRETVAGINVPTLVIAGTYDPVTPPADGRYLVDAISHSKYVELSAAHLSNVEAADSFTAAVLEFLLS